MIFIPFIIKTFEKSILYHFFGNLVYVIKKVRILEPNLYQKYFNEKYRKYSIL